MAFQNLAVGREHIHGGAGPARAIARGGDDVAICVQNHPVYAAIGAEVVQHAVRAQAAVGVDGIGAQLALFVGVAAGLRHIQNRVV